MDVNELFADLVAELSREAGVTPPGADGRSGFGSHALKVQGSIFAMLVRGHLVVKLPRARVTALIESGAGSPFDANKGTPMKEWVTVESVDRAVWSGLTHEALTFVGTRRTASTG